jgi:O-antigen/teichoic acid export membrane protein
VNALFRAAKGMALQLRDRVAGAKAATDLAILAGGQLASKVMGFFAFALLARLLTPAEYGSVETVVGMVAIGHMVIEFGSGTLGIRRIAGKSASIEDTASSVASARLMLSLAVAPLLTLGYAVIAGEHIPLALIVLFGASLFASTLKLDWLFQAVDRMEMAAIGVMIKMAVFFFVILAWPLEQFSVVTVGFAECASMALMALFFVIAQRHTFGFNLNLSRQKDGLRLLRASAPLGLSAFATTVAQSVTLLLVQALSAPEQAGEFGAAQRVVVSLITFSWLYYQNIFPVLTRQIVQNPEEAQRIVNSSDLFVAWSGVIIGIFLGTAAQPLMRLAFGEALAQSATEFSVLAWCIPVTLASGSARWLLIAQDRQKSQFTVQFVGAAVTLGLTALLAPKWGGLGAAIAMLVGAIVVWILATAFVRSCAVRPALRNMLLPAVAALSAAVLISWLKPDPVVGAVGAALALFLLAISLPSVRQACLHLMRAKKYS